jgi:hypothetical protein
MSFAALPRTPCGPFDVLGLRSSARPYVGKPLSDKQNSPTVQSDRLEYFEQNASTRLYLTLQLSA